MSITYFFPEDTGISPIKVKDSIYARPGDRVLIGGEFWTVKKVDWEIIATSSYSGDQYTSVMLEHRNG